MCKTCSAEMPQCDTSHSHMCYLSVACLTCITHITFTKCSRSVITVSDNSSLVQQFSNNSAADISALASTTYAAVDQEISNVNLNGKSATSCMAHNGALLALKQVLNFHFKELEGVRLSIYHASDSVHQALLEFGHINESLLYE
jgi:hypothetical protein